MDSTILLLHLHCRLIIGTHILPGGPPTRPNHFLRLEFSCFTPWEKSPNEFVSIILFFSFSSKHFSYFRDTLLDVVAFFFVLLSV
jgi:hypothetical protein